MNECSGCSCVYCYRRVTAVIFCFCFFVYFFLGGGHCECAIGSDLMTLQILTFCMTLSLGTAGGIFAIWVKDIFVFIYLLIYYTLSNIVFV